MFVLPVGKKKLSQVLVGLPGIGQGTCGRPVRVILTAGVQSSVAVATPNSSSRSTEQSEVEIFMSGGIVNVGGVVSPTVVIVITCVHEALPRALVAVQVMA